jgi:inositol oxygenase
MADVVVAAPAPIPDTQKPVEEFRNHVNSALQDRVERTYKLNHSNQTLEYVMKKKEEFLSLNRARMSMLEALELLNSLVDESDPDLDLGQIAHLVQTAEAVRKAYPSAEYDWLHLVALLHDTGKILAHPDFANEPMWAVVGDTFPVGCKHSEKIVFYSHFKENPDFHHQLYSTQYGAYQPGCGLDNVHMSWGHDEYMYQVCVLNGCTLPPEGLAIIRYHSFYAMHEDGEYRYLMNEHDHNMLVWIKEFNKFDLYSKSTDIPDWEEVKPYYMGLVKKYFPTHIIRF